MCSENIQMKGIVFIILNEMIEELHGIETWEKILTLAQPESGGIYIATENYPDEEMVAYVRTISSLLDLPSQVVTKLFGKHLFDELNSRYPMFAKNCEDFFVFLDSIENVIHKEVRKLYQQANLPTMNCTIVDKQNLILHYQSPRKLCYLAEGLIQGAADFYNENISLSHHQCMHDGADFCEMRVTRE